MKSSVRCPALRVLFVTGFGTCYLYGPGTPGTGCKGTTKMGVIQSVFCSFTFCVERVLTWTCCAFALILLMFTILVLMIYSISVGYHYAQKELASFAMSSRSTTMATPNAQRRSGEGADLRPVVRFVAVNRSEVAHPPPPAIEIYRRTPDDTNMYLESEQTPVFLLQTEKPPKAPELSPHERELARKLIGRFRRSKNTNVTATPFFRPIKNSTSV